MIQIDYIDELSLNWRMKIRSPSSTEKTLLVLRMIFNISEKEWILIFLVSLMLLKISPTLINKKQRMQIGVSHAWTWMKSTSLKLLNTLHLRKFLQFTVPFFFNWTSNFLKSIPIKFPLNHETLKIIKFKYFSNIPSEDLTRSLISHIGKNFFQKDQNWYFCNNQESYKERFLFLSSSLFYDICTHNLAKGCHFTNLIYSILNFRLISIWFKNCFA